MSHALFGLVHESDARKGSRDRVFLDGVDISRDCYRAQAYFDGSLIVADCYRRNSAGEFFLGRDGKNVEREVRIGIGKIVDFRRTA